MSLKFQRDLAAGKAEMPVLDCAGAGDKGKTKQSFAKDANINSIVKRFEKTGLLTHVSAMKGAYADVSDLVDYRKCLDIVAEARGLFLALPADLRQKFDNDPAKMVDFLDDPTNAASAADMGLIPKPEPKPVAPVATESTPTPGAPTPTPEPTPESTPTPTPTPEAPPS